MTSPSLSAQIAPRIVAAWLFSTTAIIFLDSTPLGVMVCAFCFLFVLFLDYRNGLLLAAAFLLSTLAMEGAVRLTAESGLKSYYRPHELLANNKDRVYRSNERVTFSSPHGDLLAIDPALERSLAEPRQIEFATDSLGFRNSEDYSGELLILVGDSFVVGNGNSQQDTLTEILKNQLNVPNYNIAFPDGPHGYALRVTEARMRFPSNACVVVFMFEGNDFRDIEPIDLSVRDRVPGPVKDFVSAYFQFVKRSSELSRLVFGLKSRAKAILASRRTLHQSGQPEARRSFVDYVGGSQMAFLTGYSEVVRRPTYHDYDYLLNTFGTSPPDHIFFIPDKYRVYFPLIGDEISSPLPHAQWQHLLSVAEQLGIGVTDLTPALQAAARRAAPTGTTTYWRDDTHWNRNGMLTTAFALVTDLAHSKVEGCRESVKMAESSQLENARNY